MLELIKELCSIDGISGREDAVREFIISKIDGYCEYSADNLGNLIAYKKGKNPAKNKVMIDAHMDEVGMLVTGINDDGTLRFTRAGGIDPKVILGKAFTVGEKRINGVCGIKPIHLTDKDNERDIPDADDMYIDIGAKNRDDALTMVTPGDFICMTGDFVEFGDGFIKSKALDDRVGCAIMIDMIRSDMEYDCVFSFSVQEEIGTRGAAASSFTVNPDYAIALETTTAADLPGAKDEERVCVTGEGAAVSFMDRSTVYNHDLYLKALEIAKEKGIKAQVKTKVAGGNNAGAIHKSRGGVKTAAISVPTRYLHSPCCVCKTDDIKAVRELAEAMAVYMATC